MTVELTPDDPPTRTNLRAGPRLYDVLVAIQARPGEWFRVGDYASSKSASAAATSMRGRKAGYKVPPGKYEFRSGFKGSYGVWGRYLGEDEDDG